MTQSTSAPFTGPGEVFTTRAVALPFRKNYFVKEVRQLARHAIQ